MNHVRFAARDPGAANLLSRFLVDAQRGASISCDMWITAKVTRYFDAIDVPAVIFDSLPSLDELRALWRKDPADALITGTSHYEPFEAHLWRISAEFNAPSLAVIDYWSNLAARFAEGLPDTVGIIDETQREPLMALGFRDIIVTGHPALAEITPLPFLPNDSLRPVSILFVSERIAEDVAEGFNPSQGFDEIDVFNLTFAACNAVAADRPVTLTVKFHPYNDPNHFFDRVMTEKARSNLSLVFVAGREPIRPLIQDSDLVLGVASVALIEAALLGRPVVSVQPNLSRENMFVPGVMGFAMTLTDPATAVEQLAEIIASPSARRVIADRLTGFRTALMLGGGSTLVDWLTRMKTASGGSRAEKVE